jgi:transketolase
MVLEPLADKLEAFNWFVITVDGHNIEELLDAFNQKSPDNKPKFIIANTIKGRGVASVEGTAGSHFFKISKEDAEEALAALKSENQEA